MLPPFISLLDITKEIQSAILLKMNRYYWVKAEVAKLNYYRQSGHCYPQLVEKKENQVLAEMRATIWANDYQSITRKFRDATGEELAEGMTILCYARVNYHPVYGLSLQIADIDPSFTLGEMAKERIQTIQRLKKEGIWLQNKSLAMTSLPQRLAVISVDSSKGYHDFRNIIDQNPWKYSFFIMLFPALLQGDKAVESIGKQLDTIAAVHHHFDAVLIIRGGGGDVGLNCFDHYDLASRVAKFPVPVISGIGHSTNETIVEMVSHTNSITPTDLAYGLLQHFHNFSVRLEELASTVCKEPEEILIQEFRRLDEAVVRVAGTARLFGERHAAHLQQIITSATLGPLRKISIQTERVASVEQKIPASLTHQFAGWKAQLSLLESKTSLLDPSNVLQRGYSIARINGKALRSTEGLSPGDRIEITLHKGVIETIADKIKNR